MRIFSSFTNIKNDDIWESESISLSLEVKLSISTLNEDKICKTRENSNFLKNGKNGHFGKNLKFF